MSLVTFLRGIRPNPQSLRMPQLPPPFLAAVEPEWVLRQQRAEGGTWAVATRAPTRAAVEELMRAHRWNFVIQPGDLASLEGPDGTREPYGVAEGGALFPMPRPDWSFDPAAAAWARGRSWPEAWRACENAAWMLESVATVVDRRALVRAVHGCIRFAHSYLPPGDRHARRAGEMLDAWADGRATLGQLQTEADDMASTVRSLAEVPHGGTQQAAVHAYTALRHALLTPEHPHAAARAVSVAATAAAAVAGLHGPDASATRVARELARLASVVRSALPLSLVVRGLGRAAS